MEHSPEWITSWATNQALVNLTKWKAYQTSFPTTILWNYKSITGKNCKKNANTQRLNYAAKQWITEEIKEEINKYLGQMTLKNIDPKPTGCSKSNFKTEDCTNTNLPQDTNKISINSLTLHLKQLEKEEQTNPEVSRRNKIRKTRAEINERWGKQQKKNQWK